MLIFRSSDFFRYSERVSSNMSEGEKLKDGQWQGYLHERATRVQSKARHRFSAERFHAIQLLSLIALSTAHCALRKDINSWVKNKSHKECYKQPWSIIIMWFIHTQPLQQAIIKYENLNLSKSVQPSLIWTQDSTKSFYNHNVFPSSRSYFMTLREAFGWTSINRSERVRPWETV